MRHLRNFWADQRGNTAVIFGLAVIPILGLAGGAVDLARRADIRTEVQGAADTAALAAARIVQSGQMARDAEWEEVKAAATASAQDVYRATVANSGEASATEPRIEITDTVVKVTAEVNVKTLFLTVLGIGQLSADAYSEANLPPPTLVEIALVLDYSGSMRDNDKYVRMTSAATTFIDKVAANRGDRTKIGIVPFSDYVYATLPGSHIRDTTSAQANQAVTACLLNRDYPYSATDEAPYGGVAASRWPQVDPSSSQCTKYSAGNLQVRDLTDDFGGLTAALSGMRPVGLTNIALATEMGWHILSPSEPFDSARDYSDTTVEKILILLTDGMQTVKAMGPDGSVSTLAADETTAELCRNMAASEIRVFTIAYDIEKERVRDLLLGCAANPSSYFEPRSAEDIAGVFESIYSQIAESMWLSR